MTTRCFPTVASNADIIFAPLTIDLYQLLLELSRDEIHFDSESYYDRWHSIQSEFKRQLPLYQYLHRLTQTNDIQLKQLNRIAQSFSWQAAKPLRYLQDKLRSRKRMMRQKQRLDKINQF